MIIELGHYALILALAVALVQATVPLVGAARDDGRLMHLGRVAALTQAFNVKFAPHAMENLHLQLVAATPNAIFLERLLLFEGVTEQVFLDAPKPVNGMMHVPDLPGLGLVLNMDFIREHDENK